MIYKLIAIWNIITCDGFWLVHRQPSGKMFRRYQNINASELSTIANDVCDKMDEITADIQAEANIQAVKEILN